MARRVAPTSNTAGVGFGFEDNVGAYFAAPLLNGESVLGRDFGSVIRLDFQTRVMGWLLDDLLVSLATGGRLALSIKSNEQITAAGLPSSFVRDAWEQYLHVGVQVFNPEQDYLGLVTSPLSVEVRTALQSLVRAACDQDEERFLTELATSHASSDLKRQIFSSLRCPDDLALQYGIRDEDAVRLLRRLRFFDFDFRYEPSHQEAESVRRCQLILVSGDPQDAGALWRELVSLTHRQREEGGYLDLRRILAGLAGRYELHQWPQYRPDLDAIEKWTNTALERIPDRIGFTIHLSRLNDRDTLSKACESSAFTAVTGPSGCGKSVLVKDWVESLDNNIPLLWLDGKDLAQSSILQLQRELGLSHPLTEVAASLTSVTAYCVIDAAGSLSTDEGFRNAAQIIRALKPGAEDSPWHIVIVSQLEEWNRVFQDISRAYGQPIQWNRVAVQLLGAEDITVVVEAFPRLAPLVVQHEIKPLLLRPKILDLVASRIALGGEVQTDQWVGESSIALWFWETEVAKRPAAIARSKAALIIAETQADQLSAQVRITDAPEGTDHLVNDRILTERHSLVSFQHDLYADWARLHVLLGHRDNVVRFVEEKLISPFWNRAVRLYGLFLLEQEQGTERWLATLNGFGESNTGSLAQDLILESVLFAANPNPLLESLWPVLRAGDGVLLRRLLGRFLYVATEPNPQQMMLARTPTEQLRFSTEGRQPYWPYWLPMLRFLHAHMDEVIHLAPSMIAETCLAWLTRTPVRWPCRKEAAEIAIALAEHLLAREWEYRHEADDVIRLAFRAALAGIRELPDAIKDFALRASGRLPRPGKPPVKPEHRPARRQTVPEYTLVKRKRAAKPWKHGPIQEANPHFAKVCLGDDGLSSIVAMAPELASEILLALLIKPPRKYDVNWGNSFMDRDQAYEINDHGNHYPPFYWHFPWLQFIRQHPEQAIDSIITLVNFASERWAQYALKNGRQVGQVWLRTEHGKARRWSGDIETYFWYSAIHGAHAVSSALMTLEYWLYAQLDAGEPIGEQIARIMSRGCSIALIGVLAAVACRQPELLKGSLRFLLHSWVSFYIEQEKLLVYRPQTAMIAWTDKSESTRKYAVDWYTMPHRERNLFEVARELFLNDADVRATYVDICESWGQEETELKRHGKSEEADIVGRFISAFTPQHYTAAYSEEHQGIVISHQFPADLEGRLREGREEAEAGLLHLGFPIRCRRILNGELSISTEEEIEAFWSDCQRIATTAEEYNPVKCREDVTCGAAAVLLLKHYKWLSEHSDRLDWCREMILDTIENPPPSSGFDTEVDASDIRWHSFCAEALPSLWLHNLSAPRLRRCAMLMALDHHYTTIGILTRACFRQRRALGDEYVRLHAVLRHWARERPDLWEREDELLNDNFILRREARRSFRDISALDAEVRDQLLSDKFRQTLDAFLVGTLAASLPSLIDRGQPPRPVPVFNHPLEHERLRIRYDLDTELLQAMYSFLPAIDTAQEYGERAEWIEQWRELLSCLLRTLAPLTPEDRGKEVDGMPYSFDRWVLNSVAILITQMTPQERPELLWRPILDLGWEAHHWVEEFLSGFLSHIPAETATDADYRSQIIDLWSAMIAYADESPSWNHQPDLHDWHLHDNWKQLMGCGGLFLLPWREPYKPLLEGMSEFLRSYCERRIVGGDIMASFIQLLRKPASERLRIRSLSWLEPKFANAGDNFWNKTQAQSQLSILLAESWQEQQDELRRDPKAFACFRRLVKMLTDRQDPLAMEIQNRIIAA
jgi:hypothetical protein